MTSISVIIPCYNRANDLHRTLRAYENQIVDEPFELIVINDASVDNTYELLTSYRPQHFKMRIKLQEKNRGPAAARNIGILSSNAPLILFGGDDILPHRNLIRGHLAAHRLHPEEEMAILGKVQWPNDLPVNTLMAHIDGIGAQQFSYHYFQDGRQYDYRHLYTANVSVKRNFLVSQEKLFDTDFEYAAFEDVELSYRLAKKGLRILYHSQLIGYHYHYHNIWTFSERMYLVGLMACKMIQKHPKTRNQILGRRWPFRIARWRLTSPFCVNSMDYVEKMETQLLHLSSSYEWRSHPNLDHLYLNILLYFFNKGLIYGTFGETHLARRILVLCASEYLSPLLKRFGKESEHRRIIPAHG